MSRPNGNRGQQWHHPILGDLTVWYPTFMKYAESPSVNGADFKGDHNAEPITLDEVHRILQEHAAEIETNPPHSLARLQAILAGEVPVEPHHEGSMCHMIWHWFHGDHS